MIYTIVYYIPYNMIGAGRRACWSDQAGCPAYIYIYIYIYIYTHIHVYIYIFLSLYVYIYRER